MRLQGFFARLLLSVLLLTGIVLSVAIIVAYKPLNTQYQDHLKSHQEVLTRQAKEYFSKAWPKKSTNIDRECQKLFKDSSIRLTIIALDGRVLGDSQAVSTNMENHKTSSRPEVLDALAGRDGKHIRPSDTLGTEFNYYAIPVTRDGKILGCIRTAMPINTIVEGTASIKQALIWAVVAAVIVAISLATIISWLWQRPLRQIATAARNIADGDLQKKVEVTGAAELTNLAKALNEMRASLADKIKRILSQQENLSAVIENLSEGVVAIDHNRHVLLCNSSARKLLECESTQVIGLDIQKVFCHPEVLAIIEKSAARQNSLDLRIRINNNIIEVQAIPLSLKTSSNISMLIVFRDISESEQIAAMKTQFVANASHELRTPLATIRAAVDSMRMASPMDEDMTSKSLDILDRHARRLEDMTNDLLDLQMTETAVDKRKELVNLGSLREWIAANFSQKATDKKIDMEIIAPDENFEFSTDMTLMHLILQNLISNAIKFTPENGMVSCMLTPMETKLLISVKDTGCGIKEEFHTRVFERFFQVDPARSGDSRLRGSGLGLAIVKHACIQLGGDIELKSVPDQGTTITVTLPL